MIGLVITAIVSSLILLYVIEVACRLKKTTHRPSTIIARIATHLYDTLHFLAYTIGLLFDLFGFVRRPVHRIRDLFFQWIPREVIEEAYRDLKAGFGQCFRVPLGLTSLCRRDLFCACRETIGSAILCFFLLIHARLLIIHEFARVARPNDPLETQGVIRGGRR